MSAAEPWRLPAPKMPGRIERQLQMTRYAVDVGGAVSPGVVRRMHVMERGRGRPVLMLHGNPTWGYLWRKVVSRLDPERFRMIVPDLIGLGYSDKPRAASEHTLENHIAWMGALVDRLGLEDVVLVVQDWGGPIGLGAAQIRPERVTGLVVLNTAISPPRPGFKASWFHRFARWPVISDLAFRAGQFPQAFLNIAQGDKQSIDFEAMEAYVRPLLDPRDNVAPLALARMVPDTATHPSIPALERCLAYVQGFRGPASIVWGTRDPILGRVLGWVEKNMPDARVWKTRAGHFLQEEVPDEIADGIHHAAAR